jgi:hypothetical protein
MTAKIETTRKDLKHWIEERNRLVKMAVDIGDMKPDFVERINFAEERISEALGLHTVNLLESLNSETGKLTKLTLALIGLTVVLSLLTLILVLGTFK